MVSRVGQNRIKIETCGNGTTYRQLKKKLGEAGAGLFNLSGRVAKEKKKKKKQGGLAGLQSIEPERPKFSQTRQSTENFF